MTVYYSMLAAASLLGVPLCCRKPSVWKNRAYILIVFLGLTILSASRYSVGVDYSYVYAPQYETVLADPAGYRLSDSRFEPGFVLLEKAVALCSQNYQALFVVTSILILALFMAWYYRNSPNLAVTIFLFLSWSHFYCSMNFIRQTIAAAIALFAIPFLRRKKFLPYLLIALLAACFHKSAFILIPFFFVNLIPLTRKYVLPAYAAVTAVLYLNSERIMALVTRFWYKGYNQSSIHVQATFEWPFTIAALAGFLLLYCLSRFLLEKDPGNYLYVNYAFFAFFFTLMGTRHSILDRLSLYFEITFPAAAAILLCSLWEQAARKCDSVLPLPPAGTPAPRAAGALMAARGPQGPASPPSRRTAGPTVTKPLVVLLCAALIGGSLAYHQYALTMDHHGVAPYQLIFDQPFYRSYAAELRDPTPLSPESQPQEDPSSGRNNPVLPPPSSVPEGAPAPVTMEEFLAQTE